ncbi:MAG: hypothetical protein ACFFCX_12070 [Candidatus Sifarchaeia archaeon]
MATIEEITKIVMTLRKEKRFKDAELVLQSAINENAQAWQLWAQLGHVLVAIENYRRAASAFETAAELNPNGFWLWVSLGHVRKELRQIDSAIDATMKATTLDRKPHEIGFALYNLACYSCSVGKFDEAIEYLDRAFKKD